jgi:hypothetical protein
MMKMKELAATLAPLYHVTNTETTLTEDDVSLCEWVKKQTGIELTLKKVEKLRKRLEELQPGIVIFISKGVLTDVRSNIKGLKVTLVDHDDENDEAEERDGDDFPEYPEVNY